MYPWEYQGCLINSSKPGMYNSTIWRAFKDGKSIAVANSLQNLCVQIDQMENANG